MKNNKESRKRYELKNKLKIQQYKKNYDKTCQGKFNRIKSKAKARGFEFELFFEDYQANYFEKECWYCGTIAIGIDRIDSNYGYIQGNMRTCCEHCNIAKSDYTEEEFIKMCALVTTKHKMEIK